MKKTILAGLIVMALALLILAFEALRDRTVMLFGKFWLSVIAFAFVVLVTLLTVHFAHARDLGQWENTDPSIREWYRSLMQPDVPTLSCCGEADAYYADDIHVRDGKTYATITDDRDDKPLNRPHVPIGTEIEIPPNKLKWDRANPTGHGVVFLSRDQRVWCFVQPGGV